MQNSRRSARPPTLGSDFHKQPLNPSALRTVPVSGSHAAARTENRMTVPWAEPRSISPSCGIGMLAVRVVKYPHFKKSPALTPSSDGGHPPLHPRPQGEGVLRMVGEEPWILAAIYLAIPAAGFVLLCSTLTLLISGFSILDICWLPWKRGYGMLPTPPPCPDTHPFLSLFPDGYVVIFVSVDTQVYVIIG